ncbi:nitrogenase iron-molybdenum cofactor biosynthesis protein NifE [Pelotomaculum terephthalicicum JT]|uniref:nitrogenase iron-molybdenum cofactor biosynthesis protein NifE n=1 Tax=Pelotomaculum TaxID=191373 RepID=UPI0009C96FEB|nr:MULTISPECIES: nitrogenase iron-molybdenum cofactor biosynthesis protein NifE [Pelotomaculum]MCG9969743.1 nitrogenase iron-molybdenum cofactor biosynthesis protein NifE [Pelotomaculum terephthalicicum JT]OPX91325.1 MAG: Nitrogenase molybdenum-iron protein alpha chain [Pelotomaculum sp. PtaB.Bin117]OPY61528.1 MAG: Nitrogenase molybdenum-iron protein alpha chain [Pelotomaculum sp. PtaU1.Bin065]
MKAVNLLELPVEERKESIYAKGKQKPNLKCDTDSIAGVVSQRACVYCGARVVLNPVTDAVHLVHGPIGCASYTWDIRGALSSGSDLYRFSFSTDLKEHDVIFGGEKKLALAIDELVIKYHPKLVFVYSTCIVGVIGDDLEMVCRVAARKHRIEVIPVQSTGFAGNKSAGYRAACDALLRLIEPKNKKEVKKSKSLNYLGDYNLAGEVWIIKSYLREMDIDMNVAFTGDSSCETLKTAAMASLNIVQCSGSMFYLAGKMEQIYGIPYMNISFLGLEDTAESLRKIARFFDDPETMGKTAELIEREINAYGDIVRGYREKLRGKKAAVYVGGGFKAISLIKQFREIGIDVVMVGTQTGRQEEYDTINDLVDEGTVILDDANPAELEQFVLEKGAHLLVGGVKERPLAYKLGIAFIDHNHDRKHPLSGFVGAVNFAEEVYATVCSPVWRFTQVPAAAHDCFAGEADNNETTTA